SALLALTPPVTSACRIAQKRACRSARAMARPQRSCHGAAAALAHDACADVLRKTSSCGPANRGSSARGGASQKYAERSKDYAVTHYLNRLVQEKNMNMRRQIFFRMTQHVLSSAFKYLDAISSNPAAVTDENLQRVDRGIFRQLEIIKVLAEPDKMVVVDTTTDSLDDSSVISTLWNVAGEEKKKQLVAFKHLQQIFVKRATDIIQQGLQKKRKS
ncbi:hypothetical protein CYMTET_26537, partial [Cymbomonas tetramitiformis]